MYSTSYSDSGGFGYSSYITTALPANRGFGSAAHPAISSRVEFTPTVGKPKIIKTMKDDIKNFIIENRTIIYWLMILLIVDQWIFQGRFREKLHELFESLIDRIKKLFESHEPYHLAAKP